MGGPRTTSAMVGFMIVVVAACARTQPHSNAEPSAPVSEAAEKPVPLPAMPPDSPTPPPTYPELTFFNSLSGRLEIELTEPPTKIAERLENVKATPSAKIKSLRLTVEVFDKDQARPLTAAELDSVALRQPRVVLVAESGHQVAHDAPNHEFFTVRDLVDAVEQTERKLRGESEWFGGVDVHHIYFEGLEPVGPATFQVLWGS